MRAIENATCSCGGVVREVEPAPEEDKRNCSRGCCLTILECDKCKTRFVLKLEAPEME
jgi:hypothetical protein